LLLFLLFAPNRKKGSPYPPCLPSATRITVETHSELVLAKSQPVSVSDIGELVILLSLFPSGCPKNHLASDVFSALLPFFENPYIDHADRREGPPFFLFFFLLSPSKKCRNSGNETHFVLSPALPLISSHPCLLFFSLLPILGKQDSRSTVLFFTTCDG